GPRIPPRLRDRLADVHLRRVMVHDVASPPLPERLLQLRFADVHPPELHPLRNVGGPARGQIVHDPDPVTPVPVRFRHVAADEPRAPGHKHPLAAHSRPPSASSSSSNRNRAASATPGTWPFAAASRSRTVGRCSTFARSRRVRWSTAARSSAERWPSLASVFSTSARRIAS